MFISTFLAGLSRFSRNFRLDYSNCIKCTNILFVILTLDGIWNFQFLKTALKKILISINTTVVFICSVMIWLLMWSFERSSLFTSACLAIFSNFQKISAIYTCYIYKTWCNSNCIRSTDFLFYLLLTEPDEKFSVPEKRFRKFTAVFSRIILLWDTYMFLTASDVPIIKFAIASEAFSSSKEHPNDFSTSTTVLFNCSVIICLQMWSYGGTCNCAFYRFVFN